MVCVGLFLYICMIFWLSLFFWMFEYYVSIKHYFWVCARVGLEDWDISKKADWRVGVEVVSISYSQIGDIQCQCEYAWTFPIISLRFFRSHSKNKKQSPKLVQLTGFEPASLHPFTIPPDQGARRAKATPRRPRTLPPRRAGQIREAPSVPQHDRSLEQRSNHWATEACWANE